MSPLPGHPEAGSLLSASARSRTEGEQRPLELNPGEAGEKCSSENIAQRDKSESHRQRRIEQSGRVLLSTETEKALRNERGPVQVASVDSSPMALY